MVQDENGKDERIREDSSGRQHSKHDVEELLQKQIGEIVDVVQADSREATPQEISWYEKEKNDQELAKGKEALVSARQDRVQRKQFSEWIFILIVSWLVGIYIVVLLAGRPDRPLMLHDNVLIALIATTTIKVVGLLYVVANPPPHDFFGQRFEELCENLQERRNTLCPEEGMEALGSRREPGGRPERAQRPVVEAKAVGRPVAR